MDAEIAAQPEDIKARLFRLRMAISENGPSHVPPKYIKHIVGKLWESRLKGKDGIARALYGHNVRKALSDRASFHEEVSKDTATRDKLSIATRQGDQMTKSTKKPREMISLDDMAVEWFKDPNFVKAYNDLEEEFSLLGEIMKVRAKSGLTQAQIAERMQTTQAAVARLESGNSLPSTRTLQRFAKATGHRLKITFEPEPTG